MQANDGGQFLLVRAGEAGEVCMADDVGSMPVVVGMADGEADFMEDCAPSQKFPGLIVQLPALGDGSEELVGSGGNTLGLRVIDSGVIGEILNGPLTSVVAGEGLPARGPKQ